MEGCNGPLSMLKGNKKYRFIIAKGGGELLKVHVDWKRNDELIKGIKAQVAGLGGTTEIFIGYKRDIIARVMAIKKELSEAAALS